MRSPNIIQVHTLDSVYQCHRTPEEAEANCPTWERVRAREAREVMLYKTRGYYGTRDSFEEVLCPVFGQWRFTFTDRGDPSNSCSSPASWPALITASPAVRLGWRIRLMQSPDVLDSM